MAAFAGGCAVKLRAVCRSMEVRGVARRPRWLRRHGEEAAEALRGGAVAQHGVAAWRHCMAAWRPRGEPGARCVLWVHTGCVGRVGTTVARTSVRLTLRGGVCRCCVRVCARVRQHPSGVCRCRLPWRTRRRHAVSVWCSRARRACRMRAGRAGRTGAVGLVGRVGCARDMRDAEGRQACVAGGEGARCMSPGS